MKPNRIWNVLTVVTILTLLISACAQPSAPQVANTPVPTPITVSATNTSIPSPTKEAEPTKAPTEEIVSTPDTTSEIEEFPFGILMVGPYNDRGWSETHYNAGLYLEEHVPGAKLLYIDRVNPADRPGTTASQLATELVDQGAKMIIFTSDDMGDAAVEFANQYPDLPVIHVSGDAAWEEGVNYKNLPNLKNVMGRMEYGQMIGGCAAALSTETGKIGFIGALIAPITLRGVAATYLGAKHCWTNYRQEAADDLTFTVNWIGFWFNIPGFTSDPSQVADAFLDSGYDVLISGLDTTEALVQTNKAASAGRNVYSVAYEDYKACSEMSAVCLGVPTFNWVPTYVESLEAAMNGTFAPSWEWEGPDWNDMNNVETSWIGFQKGAALDPEASESLDQFIVELAGGLELWKGPMNLQDGTPYLEDGEVASDYKIWYLPQLLEGIEGQSIAE